MDYKVTDAELTQVADAIRARSGKSEKLVWPWGFEKTVEGIPAGHEFTDEDEGKVVIDRELLEQKQLIVNANGRYDTSANAPVIVDISQPSTAWMDDDGIVYNGMTMDDDGIVTY
jgi:hypothetical protein